MLQPPLDCAGGRAAGAHFTANVCQTAEFVYISKPKEIPTQPASFRLISLFCDLVIIFQSLLVKQLRPYISVIPPNTGQSPPSNQHTYAVPCHKCTGSVTYASAEGPLEIALWR